MEGDKYKFEEFKSFLLTDHVQESEVPRFINTIKDFIEFLEESNETIFSFTYGKLIKYADTLATQDKEKANDLIHSLWRYFPFIGKYHHIEELIDILESYSAMDTLYDRIAEWHGEEIQDEIFKNIDIPPLGIHPEKKPEVTKTVMNRLVEKLGEEKTKELLRPCLHGGQEIGNDKEKFHEIKDIDVFLNNKFQDLMDEVEQHRSEGTAMFAQLVDDEVVKYVRSIPSMGPGIRDNNRIIISKIPYQIKKFLDSDENHMKRYYMCYCPWVRGAIKDGTEKEISPNFCYCSGGYYKIYWDEIFGQSVTIEPLKTALWGDLICEFAMEIPKEFMEEYV